MLTAKKEYLKSKGENIILFERNNLILKQNLFNNMREFNKFDLISSLFFFQGKEIMFIGQYFTDHFQ